MSLKSDFNKFNKIPLNEKLLLVEAFVLMGIARLFLLVLPFKTFSKYLGKHMQESTIEITEKDLLYAKKVALAIGRAHSRTPWQSLCLVQAATCKWMLSRRNIPGTIYLGVEKNHLKDMKAHAWFRCGQLILTGGYELHKFTVVSKFGTPS